MSIFVRDIVVGDVLVLEQGDRVPADCILIEEMNIVVDQSIYNSKEGQVKKEESLEHDETKEEPDNHKENPDPFLLTDSKVLAGQGKALVLAVGNNTLAAKKRSKEQLVLSEQHTNLEKKLDVIAENCGKYATVAAVLSVLTHLVFFVC